MHILHNSIVENESVSYLNQIRNGAVIMMKLHSSKQQSDIHL